MVQSFFFFVNFLTLESIGNKRRLDFESLLFFLGIVKRAKQARVRARKLLPARRHDTFNYR